MFRKISQSFKKAMPTTDASDQKKPTFPAYVPSHMEANKYDDSKYNRGVYENNQIYVTNLPPNANMEEINGVFPNCVGISLGVNNLGESNAAFVEFLNSDDAKKACTRSRGASLHGNTLIISPKLKFN